MFLLSSGNTTKISEWLCGLQLRDGYKHENNGMTDFQFFPKQLVYAEVHKNKRVEFLRINEKMDEKTLTSYRMSSLYDKDALSIACPKGFQKKIAIGMRNGSIKLYDHIRSEVVHQIPADPVRSSVSQLDYNSSDQYLSAVLANGQINIYGNYVITDRIYLESWMARFHPIDSSRLFVATRNGDMIIYDITSKRIITKYQHDNCSDFSMSSALPNTIITVGKDRHVKIYDTRDSTGVQDINMFKPLSAVALSKCGNYYCFGTTSGLLKIYDVCTSRRSMASEQVHDGHVSRIAFFHSKATESRIH